MYYLSACAAVAATIDRRKRGEEKEKKFKKYDGQFLVRTHARGFRALAWRGVYLGYTPQVGRYGARV